MAVLKTQKTKKNVPAFIKSTQKARQSDCQQIIEMMTKATGSKPAMWGESIIGFGEERLKYESGRELDWFKIGFSPRKGKISLYCTCNTKTMAGIKIKLAKIMIASENRIPYLARSLSLFLSALSASMHSFVLTVCSIA